MVIRHVKGTGPKPCRLMLVAERPGKVENSRGITLVGPSGQETNRYLAVNSGIDRSNIYCTNVVKTYSEESPSPEEIERDCDELMAEIKAVEPEYICAMGLYAARWFLGPEIELEWAHGLAFSHFMTFEDETALDLMVMPVFHAAAGLHQPAVAAKVAWDFEQFGRMYRGDKMPDGHLRDRRPNPLYVENWIIEEVVNRTIAVDTEGSPDNPWCVSYSSLAGRAEVIRCPGEPVHLEAPKMILHNALWDLMVLEAMGVTVGKWDDTMLMANLLGIEPQGLKALARRHCGMVMSSYDEIIHEARRNKALNYLSSVIDYAEANPVEAD